jgi:hypothetical protein
MKRLWLAAGLALIGTAGVAGVSALALSGNSAEEAVIESVATPTITGSPPTATADDPCSQYEDPAEFHACIEPYIQQYVEKETAFWAQFAASGQDIHSLPLVQGFGRKSMFIIDADALLNESDLIIRGRVISQALGDSRGTIISDLEITEAFKGDPADRVVLKQVGGPALDNDRPILIEYQDDPLLWLGGEYILYLDGYDVDGAFRIDSANALYAIENGVVSTLGETDWAKAANGMPVDEFVSKIQQDVSAGTTAR